ncbi:MAG: glycosyltransferase [Anaerolineae bacterium]
MNIGFVSTRLAGTDGVSLETAKMAAVLHLMGHQVFYCAGELDDNVPGLEAPELHFWDPVAVTLGDRTFVEQESEGKELIRDIERRARQLENPIRRFITDFQIEYLIVQNAFAIPMQLPLAQAITHVLQETGLPALAHNHDFYWERERFAATCIPDFLDTYFPPALPNLQHAVINSAAQRDLHTRRGLESILIPNVFDFDTPPPGIDDYNADFRQAIGLREKDWLILQPTRVVPRKGIELAIELIARLEDPRAKLIITHQAGDEGMGYLQHLQNLAAHRGVDFRYVADRVDDVRGMTDDGRKIYALWDTYPHADFVTYPSLYEGFGNALIETVYFQKPAVVNRYPVYQEDIGPLGFKFVEIDGKITEQAVERVRAWLHYPESTQEAVTHNFALGREHFSYQTLRELLGPLLAAV